MLQENTVGQLDLVCTSYSSTVTDTLLATKQPSLVVSNVTGESLLNGTTLKRLNFSSDHTVSVSGGALGISYDLSGAMATLGTYALSADTYTRGNGLAVEYNSNSEKNCKIQMVSSYAAIRYRGGHFRLDNRNEDSNGDNLGVVMKASDTTLNVQFFGIVTGVSFTSTSDKSLKDNVEDLKVEDCMAILNAVDAKQYTRNDRGGEPRVGYIAQNLKSVCSGHFAHIVGTTTKTEEDAQGEEIPGSERELLTVDYSRLVTILWTCLKDTNNRVTQLENTILQMQQTVS